jgi:cbb3-type cytochrome oxidase maturation protein
MLIVVLLIAISLFIALIFLGVFYWNIRSGQYDDMYTPSVRMLFEEEKKPDSAGAAGEKIR